MKRNLFKMIPLLLGGVMVLLSGCVKRADFDALTDRVATLEAELPTVKEQIATLQSALSTLEADVNAQLATVNGKLTDLDDAAASAKTRLDELEKDLATQVAALKSELKGDITNLETQLGAATSQNAEAIATLQTTLGTIKGTLEKLDETYATDADLAAAVEQLTAAIDAAEAELTSTLGKTFQDALKGYAELARVETLEEKVNGIDLEQVKADYTKAINDAIAAAVAEGGVISEAVKAQVAALVAGLQGQLDALSGKLDAVIGRIQSVVFVPEYTDGKATINYATVGSALVETISTLQYQVTPAECADALAKGAQTFLSFNFQPLKSRAAAQPSLVVKSAKVVDAAKGIIEVTVKASNLAANFYKKNGTNYAVSLVVNYADVENKNVAANLASSYVSLYPVENVYTVKVVDDATSAYEIEYTENASNPEYTKVDVMKANSLQFSNAGNVYTLADLQALYMEISVEPSVTYNPETSTIFNNDHLSPGHKTADHIYSTVNLTNKVVKGDVGKKETVKYVYTIKADDVVKGEKITATTVNSKVATVTIVKPQRYFDFVFSNNSGEKVENYIKWNYVEDAATDVTGETQSVDVVKVFGDKELPEDTTWASMLASKITTTIVVDGKVANGVTATYGTSANGDMTLTLKDFAWGKVYTITTKFELAHIDINVTIVVETIDRSHDVIVLPLQDWEILFTYQLDVTSMPESLADIFTQVTKEVWTKTEKKSNDFSNFKNAAEYLKTVLLDNTSGYYKVNACTVKATYSDKTTATYDSANSKLTLGKDGSDMSARYFYGSDFTATPDNLEYLYDVTTWYGQQIKITKLATIVKAVSPFDFMRVNSWVTPEITSSAAPEYYGENALYGFDLKKIKLREAFNVVPGNIQMTDESLYNNKVVLKYTAAQHDGTDLSGDIDDDFKFSYLTKEKSVKVKGHLYLASGIGEDDSNHNLGELVEIPTKFDNEYSNYIIYGFNPIKDSFQRVPANEAEFEKITTIALTEANLYRLNIWSLLQIEDKRNVKLFADGKWVIGDGSNGFATNYSPDVAAIYNAKMSFTFNEAEVKEYPELFTELSDGTQRIKLAEETGLLTIDYTNKFNLVKPVDFFINVKLEHQYGTTVTEKIRVRIYSPLTVTDTPAQN